MREHLDLPLFIYNYTDQAQYAQLWNDVTMNCRGLIADADGNIVARGFPKFFNYGQPGAAEFKLDDIVEVTDKMDGSLGIMYPTPDGYRIATRGSFHSDQAGYASMILRTRYPDFTLSDILKDGYTVLFEIIYPDNRIVLDYGDMSDLVLLGMVSNDTGITHGPDNVGLRFWNGPRAQNFGRMTFAEALALPPRQNAEGLVIRDRLYGNMVKIKQEDYIRLHKLVFGLSEKAVWEHLSTHDGDITGMLEGLPDEFHGWVKEKADSLLLRFRKIRIEAEQICDGIIIELTANEDGGSRKRFAEIAAEYPDYRQYLFMLLDGKDISGAIWKSLKPKGSSPMVRQTEATA
jgi:RNA ligase